MWSIRRAHDTSTFLRVVLASCLVVATVGLSWFRSEPAGARALPDDLSSVPAVGSLVTVQQLSDGSFEYLVNGSPQLFIGMGYNPIYRDLTDSQRAANYDRDFRLLCEAGVNTITGWDTDKGYEQDKFDEVTLDLLSKYDLGVIMPFYLPQDGDYTDPALQQSLIDAAALKVERFKNHPAIRMWGVGNEMLDKIHSPDMQVAFAQFFVQLADLFHEWDPNHPVIYRNAEDLYLPVIQDVVTSTGQDRPWLLYGVNAYTPRLSSILDSWPSNGFNRPVFVTEFGVQSGWLGSRGQGYVAMWRMIRAHPDYVLGGAPYAWTTRGPEPTDSIWGLMGRSTPVDDTFELLSAEWQKEYSTPPVCD